MPTLRYSHTHTNKNKINIFNHSFITSQSLLDKHALRLLSHTGTRSTLPGVHIFLFLNSGNILFFWGGWSGLWSRGVIYNISIKEVKRAAFTFSALQNGHSPSQGHVYVRH